MDIPGFSRARWCVLALVALMAGCGGGGGGAPAPGTGSDAVQMAFVQPQADQNVYTSGDVVALQAHVQLDGAAAPDGLQVQWSADAGTLQALQSNTSGGYASVSLATASAGPVNVQASIALQGQSASAQQRLYVRPQPVALEILVPAYFDAGGTSSDWDVLTRSLQNHPEVRVTAILNPSNGVFTRVDPALLQAVADFRAAGGQVLGYVLSGYGSRSASVVRQNVDRYLNLYGSENIDGFFIDEMAAASKSVAYYADVYAYIKGIDNHLRVIGNPGTLPVQGYSAVVDTLVTFEGPEADYRQFALQPDGVWLYNQGNAAQAMLVHDAVGCAAMQASLLRATTVQLNTGVVYVTDLHYNVATGQGNPWAALPSYWDQLVASVSALNRGSALPSCT